MYEFPKHLERHTFDCVPLSLSWVFAYEVSTMDSDIEYKYDDHWTIDDYRLQHRTIDAANNNYHHPSDKREYKYSFSMGQKNGSNIEKVPQDLRFNKRIVKVAPLRWERENVSAPEPKNVFIDKDYVTNSVKRKWYAFQYAPAELRNDKEVARAAIMHYPMALQFAGPDVRNDKSFVLAAISKNDRVFQFASPALRNDKEVVMAAVSRSAVELNYASSELRNDKDIVMTAVSKWGHALQYASSELRNDKEVVMAAVTQCGSALQYASPELRNDKEIAMLAITNDSVFSGAGSFVSEELLGDKDIALLQVQADPEMIKRIQNELKRDPDILMAAGMFDKDHTEHRSFTNTTTCAELKKLVLSTRFALDKSSSSEATRFTKLLKHHWNHWHFFRRTKFKVYAPNAFDKNSCDPNWTSFDWTCRGTRDTCQYNNMLDPHTGKPTDDCCWRFSFRRQLEEAKDTGGLLLQFVEKANGETQKLGDGQKIERHMAQDLGVKNFLVYRAVDERDGSECSVTFEQVHTVLAAIKRWYIGGCQDMSEHIIRLTSRSNI